MILNQKESMFVKCPSISNPAFKKNLVLYNFLFMENVPQAGFSIPYEIDSQKFTFPFWIGYLSCLQNPEIENKALLQEWIEYVEKIVKLASAGCKYPLSKAETLLYTYAIAIRTYPNVNEHIANIESFSSENLQMILNIDAKKNEQKWALYIVASAVLYALEKDDVFRPHLFLGFMRIARDLDNEFPALEKKFDTYRIGKGLYE